MKKIINGRKYNTETAEEIACWGNGLGWNDFNCVYETLYRKRTGEFFIHGEGGGLSRYAVHYGDGWGYGEQIRPLTESQARSWAEKHMDADDYEEVFGVVEE